MRTQSKEHRDQCETRQQHGPAHNATRLMDKRKNMTPKVASGKRLQHRGGACRPRAGKPMHTHACGSREGRHLGLCMLVDASSLSSLLQLRSTPETTVEYRKRDITTSWPPCVGLQSGQDQKMKLS